VARQAGVNAAVGIALALYALQMGLNCLWTPVFFGLKRMRAGMLVLALLWLAVAMTLVAFWRVDWVAGLLFLPYLTWVTIAGALNYSVMTLNPDQARNQDAARA
jgi:tryptophan-rich sensory protein